jgi:hypothetical protein
MNPWADFHEILQGHHLSFILSNFLPQITQTWEMSEFLRWQQNEGHLKKVPEIRMKIFVKYATLVEVLF